MFSQKEINYISLALQKTNSEFLYIFQNYRGYKKKYIIEANYSWNTNGCLVVINYFSGWIYYYMYATYTAWIEYLLHFMNAGTLDTKFLHTYLGSPLALHYNWNSDL